MSKHTNERTETHACDLISREKAIDAVNAWLLLRSLNRTMSNATSLQDVLRQLPSAQPTIIYCKDCKNCETRTTANYIPFLFCKLNEHSVSENAFCCWAERGTDE